MFRWCYAARVLCFLLVSGATSMLWWLAIPKNRVGNPCPYNVTLRLHPMHRQSISKVHMPSHIHSNEQGELSFISQISSSKVGFFNGPHDFAFQAQSIENARQMGFITTVRKSLAHRGCPDGHPLQCPSSCRATPGSSIRVIKHRPAAQCVQP